MTTTADPDLDEEFEDECRDCPGACAVRSEENGDFIFPCQDRAREDDEDDDEGEASVCTIEQEHCDNCGALIYGGGLMASTGIACYGGPSDNDYDEECFDLMADAEGEHAARYH